MSFPSTVGPLDEGNTPGACKLQFARVEDILTFPQEVRGTVPTEIVLREGAVWKTIVPTKFTQSYKAKWILRDGDQYEYASLGFYLPKDRVALLDALWQLKPGRYVVLHHDLNGTVKVMGTKDEPATLRVNELQHGGDPRREGNRYVAMVEVSRRTECPFYLATPPTPVEPGSCPGLVDLLGTNSASAIATAMEAAGVLAAVQALICDTCPTLCQLLDDAIVLGGGAEFLGVDAVLNTQSGTIPVTGTTNGKPSGSTTDFPSGFAEFLWNGSAWMVSDGFSTWTSTEDVATPGEVTTWSGSAPLPTVADSFGGGGDASAIVDCLSPEQAAVLAEALGAVGGGTVTIRTTADDATVDEVEAPDTVLLPQTSIPYVDEAGDEQVLAPVNTGFAAGTLRPATVLPRFMVLAGDGITWVVRGSVVDHTVTLPESTIKYRNTSNVLVETTPATTQFNGLTLKPATEVPRRAQKNSAGTGFSFVTLEDLVDDTVPTMPDSVITLPSGATVNNPAGVAFNVNSYRSGITYNFGRVFWTGQDVSYRNGDEGWMWLNGWFDYTRPALHLHHAEIATWNTMQANNIHGNTLRFTNRSGGAAATSGNRWVRDHSTGIEYYIFGTMPSLTTWDTAMDAAWAASIDGSDDLFIPPEDILKTITKDNQAQPLNYGPFLITVDIWTGTTDPADATQARRCVNSGGGGLFGRSLKSGSNASYIYCRKFL